MSKRAQRYTQHRQEREPKVLSKQLRHLKGENQKLAKQNARLRKEIEKSALVPEEKYYKQELLTEAPDEWKERINKPACPKCNSNDMAEITVIGRTYRVCRDCKYRERVAA